MNSPLQSDPGAFRFSSRWITSRNFDLLWYVGAASTGYILLFLNLKLAVPALLLFWSWILLADGPHVFGTISRTYLDKEERRNRGALLWGSLLWLLPGPMVLLISVSLKRTMPFFLFLTLAQVWAYWHVVRQHYGFLSLYQWKNNEPSGRANPVDYWSFYVLMLAPFVSFLMRHPDARAEMGLTPQPLPMEQAFLLCLHAAILIALVSYAAKEYRRMRKGQPWNLPKNVFLSACIPLHLFIFLHPVISTHVDIRLFAVFLTVYHNLQYLALVWFYNRNRYGEDRQGIRFGWASLISRNFIVYYFLGLLYTLLYRLPNWYFSAIPFSARAHLSQLPSQSLLTFSNFAISIWWGFAFHHYYLDQKIWKPGKDRRLAFDLRVESGVDSRPAGLRLGLNV